MLFTFLILIITSLLLAGFGIYPAFEYTNTGALLMLALAVFLLILAIFLRPVFSVIRRTILGKIILIAVVLFTAYFATIQFLIISASQPPTSIPKTDAIIVLGAGLTYDTEDPSLALSYRLDQAIEYLKEYPDTPIIVSGGQGEIEQVSEAYAMQQYLIRAGINLDQIILEDRSTTTAENLSFSAEILQQNNFHNIAIITSDYHCYRAQLLAERNNITSTCIPARNVWWLAPADHFREFLALSNALLFP